MDACHLLLGRPWQFDKQAMHDGAKYAYSFNKAAYKMTPQQNEEIAKQIQELLDQGLIRRSISPCVVPTVLAPKKRETWRLCTD